jgi:hypothetical protein
MTSAVRHLQLRPSRVPYVVVATVALAVAVVALVWGVLSA